LSSSATSRTASAIAIDRTAVACNSRKYKRGRRIGHGAALCRFHISGLADARGLVYTVDRLTQKEGMMQLREILRIKGNLLVTIAPDGLVSDGVNIMTERDIGSLVVMNQGRMVGMLTFREVLQALHENQGSIQGLRVDAIMVKHPRTMAPNVEVDELRSVMLKDHIRYMPVTEGDNLIGVLSFHDVARAVLEEQAFENRMLKGYIKDSPT
jgi:CBS domain-containing protein